MGRVGHLMSIVKLALNVCNIKPYIPQVIFVPMLESKSKLLQITRKTNNGI